MQRCANSKDRIAWVDIVKGFAIMAVVALHSYYVLPSFKFLNVSNIIGGTWHVPVFFLVAGFFLKEEKIIQPITFLKSKLKTLYIPFVSYTIAAILLHNTLLTHGLYAPFMDGAAFETVHYTSLDIIKQISLAFLTYSEDPITNPLWFLSTLLCSLIFLSISFYSISVLFDKQRRSSVFFLFILSLFIFVFVIKRQMLLSLPIRITKIVTASWLIYVGYILNRKIKVDFKCTLPFLSSLLITWFYTTYGLPVNLSADLYESPITLTIGGVASLFVLCYCAIHIEHTRLGYFFQIIGRNSLHIMALHLFIFKILSVILYSFGFCVALDTLFSPANTFFLWFFYTILGCILPVVIVAVWEPIYNLFFAYKR